MVHYGAMRDHARKETGSARHQPQQGLEGELRTAHHFRLGRSIEGMQSHEWKQKRSFPCCCKKARISAGSPVSCARCHKKNHAVPLICPLCMALWIVFSSSS